MLTKIKKWGNSQGLRLNKELLTEVGIELDDEVNIEIEDGKIVITKAIKDEIILKELFSEYKGEYKPKEIDWGEPEGDEVW